MLGGRAREGRRFLVKRRDAGHRDWGANDKRPAEIFKELGLKETPWLDRTRRWK